MAKGTCAVYGTTRDGYRHPDSCRRYGKAWAIGALVLLVGIPEVSAQTPNGWDWSARLATNHEEFASDIAVDTLNQAVYTAGRTERGFSGILGGLWALLFGGDTHSDGYLLKQSFDGTVQWQIVVGGQNEDGINGVTVDALGNIYVTGFFTGNNASFTGTSGSDQRMSSAGGTDIFVACYSPAGVLQWKLRAGANGDDQGSSICQGGGQVYVGGSFNEAPAIAGLATSSSAGNVANRSHAFLVSLQAVNGTGVWRVDGTNGENSAFNALATDGTQVYAMGSHKGAYTYTGTATMDATLPTISGSGLSADVVALTMAGSINWVQAVSNPGSDQINALGLASSGSAVYISGSTHNGSTFPGGMVVNLVPASHDHGYVARLDIGSGATDWVRTFTSPASHDHSQVGRDLATDNHGDVLLAGMYEESLTLPNGIALSGASDLQIFVAKISGSGLFKWAISPTGSGDDQPNGIATDGAGKVFIAGGYVSNISFNTNFSDDNSQNLFVAALTDLEYAVAAFHDPSAFRSFGPICAGDGPVDLTALLLPVRSGAGVSVFSSSGIATSGNNSPAAALGTVPGGVAVFDNLNDQIIIDMGDTIPVGAPVILRWKSNGGTASMNVQGALAGSGIFTDLGNITTTSTAMVFTGITATAPMRFVKLTRGAGSTCEVDGIYYNFGSATDGAWSGPGVTGTTFNPSGLSGTVAITYTAQGHATTHTVVVDELSEAGVLSGGGTICPGADATMALNGTVGASIMWRLSTDGGVTWSSIPAGQPSHTFSEVTVPTQVYAQVSNGGCPADLSNLINILPLDTTPPVIIGCPGNITAYTSTSSCNAIVNYTCPTATDSCGNATMTVDNSTHLPLAAFPKGVTVVHWTAVDENGNSSTCQFAITVLDTIRPSITCPAAVATTTSTGCTATGVNLGMPSTADNCAVASVTNNAPANFPIGSTTVIWRVEDASGNFTTCSQAVTVSDATPPTISCPAAVAATANTGCTATGVNLGTPSTADNCTVASVTSNAPASFPIGTTTVTWVVTDAGGNSTSCVQTVSVTDATPPTITCPAAVAAITNNGCTATGVNLGTPSTADNCTVASVTNDAPAAFPIGTTTVHWVVTDGSGNSATCAQMVTVTDGTPPTITCPAAVAATANTGCTATGVNLGTPSTADNCTVASVTNNAPAAFPFGTTTVTWVVTDAGGNSTSCVQTVTVTDATPPTISCPAAVVANTNTGCTATGVNLGTPSTADNCTVASVTNDAPAAFPIGTTTVHWVVTDGSGNSANCAQMVTVTDGTPPTITCPAAAVATANTGCTATGVNLGTPSTADNCTVASVTNDAPSAFPIGLTTVQWTVTDASGNTATCPSTVTVLDIDPPDVICADTVQVAISAGLCSVQAFIPPPQMADNCSMAFLTDSASVDALYSGSWFPQGLHSVTYIVSDASGNTATCTSALQVAPPNHPSLNYPVAEVCTNTASFGTTGMAPPNAHYSATPPGLAIDPDLGIIYPANSAPGTYSVLLTIQGPCPLDTTVQLVITGAADAGSDTSVVICETSTEVVDLFTVLGGSPQPGGTWRHGTVPVSGLFDPSMDGPGLYTYLVPGSNACGPDSAVVIVSLVAASYAGMDTSLTVCSNTAVVDLMTLLADADDGGTWSNGTGLFDPASDLPGVITYMVAGYSPCPNVTASITLLVNPAPDAGSAGTLNLCTNGGAADLFSGLQGNPEQGGQWTDAADQPVDPDFFPGTLAAGTYTYTITGMPPCASASSTVTVTYTDPGSAAWTAPQPLCSSAAAIDLGPYVTGMPGGTWSGPGVNGTSFDPGTVPMQGNTTTVELLYTVSANNCANSASGSITVLATPEANAGPDAAACGLSYQLAATAPAGTGSWSASGNDATFSPVTAVDATVIVQAPGAYPLQWSISNGQCSDVDTVIITFHLPEELTALDAGPDQAQDITRHATLAGTVVGATEIHWSMLAGGGNLSSPEQAATDVEGLAIGANIFKLSARVGVCPFVTDTVTITVRDLFIPSGFSPNGDGVNDQFEVIGIEVLTNNEFTVFNRWGQQVYHATSYANQWDGHGAAGQVLTDDTYFYVLKFSGDATTYHGQVIIKR